MHFSPRRLFRREYWSAQIPSTPFSRDFRRRYNIFLPRPESRLFFARPFHRTTHPMSDSYVLYIDANLVRFISFIFEEPHSDFEINHRFRIKFKTPPAKSILVVTRSFLAIAENSYNSKNFYPPKSNNPASWTQKSEKFQKKSRQTIF